MLAKFRILAAAALAMLSANLFAAETLWQELSTAARGPGAAERHYRADAGALRARLAAAPHESSGDRSLVLEIPVADGRLERFAVVESPVMQPGLAADFPSFKTYRAFGIDDPLAGGRLSLTSLGFHAMLSTAAGRVFIDPQNPSAASDRFVLRARRAWPAAPQNCAVEAIDQSQRPRLDPLPRVAARVPGMLLEYDLAVAATEEYRVALGGTIADAQAGIVVAINRVNQIYERDLGIRLTLVANNQDLIEFGGNVSFTNDDAFAMFAENQAWIDSEIGSANYDIGHVFSTGGGGLARLGSACNAANKAQGVTGQNNPFGDPFYIDFVAHEIGHQFNADHSFNGTTNACGGINRSGPTAWEPGSGSTIMGYAGICGVEDLQPNSDATFHAGSIGQIDAFVGGLGCGTQIATSPMGNTDPMILTPVPNTSHIIPVGTPFALEATAADSDMPAQTLSYQWDQVDPGLNPTTAVSFGTDLGDNPLFRSYEPQPASRRDFPALGTQLQNLFDDAEVIPCNARVLNFRLTVRDGASGQDTEDVRVTATTAAGPFRITNLGTPQTLNVLDNNLVTWDVANTNAGAVGCPEVVIELLTFANGGRTQYAVHPLNGGPTLNDGNELLIFPDPALSHPRARIRIRCANNVFYDISDADLNIAGTTAALYSDDVNDTFFNNNGTTGFAAPACGSPVSGVVVGGGGNGDSSSADPWLLAGAGLLLLVARRRRRQG